MKLKTLTTLLTMTLLMSILGVLLVGCGNDDNNPKPDYAEPTISISSPGDVTSLSTVVAKSISFTLDVTAEAGLSSVSTSVNGASEVIKNFSNEETSAQVSYDFTPTSKGSFDLIFSVEDLEGEIISLSSISIAVASAPFVVVDFAGNTTSNSQNVVSDWDTRTKYVIGVTGSQASTADIEVVNNQGQLSFAVDNPVSTESEKVLKLVRVPHEGVASWGGYVNTLIEFESSLPSEIVEALPSWNADSDETISGTKVIRVEVFYDETVNGSLAWSDILSTEKNQWVEADPANGYPVEITLGNYDNHSPSPDAGGYYMSYVDYIDTPNEWVTLEFTAAATTRSALFHSEPEATNPATSTTVDCVNIMPARGYFADDSNPIYFKNLRIEDLE